MTEVEGGYEIERGLVRETQYFPSTIRRRDVLRLAHKFKVDSRYFWNPETLPGESCDPEKPLN
ncbi:MAG: hypothetical protein MPN21_22360, partial [Thermoanaerobaculia bacterium]|nr:hypothetical protein [Thermoanaerobaculia bacterium]